MIYFTQVLMVLGTASKVGGGEVEFDYRPIRVVELFGRREQRAKELKKVKRWDTPRGLFEMSPCQNSL